MGTGSNVGSNSGTGQSVAGNPIAVGVILPAPKVQTYKPAAPADLFACLSAPVAGTPIQITPTRSVKVTVPGLPQAILENLETYKPRVELLRFTRKNTRENGAGGNGTKSSGYVHPSHGLTPGGGSFTHGGHHGGVDPAIWAIRPTEWDISAGNVAIDVTQGMAGFMCILGVKYRDNTGTMQVQDMLVPSANNQRGKFGRRFPYSRKFTPGYFEFRVSIIDPTDARGKRIHGPHSTRVSATNNIFPFLPAGLDVAGQAQATLDPRFDARVINFWLGASSRLPAQ